jgi:outer membrane protein assembly factor BamB
MALLDRSCRLKTESCELEVLAVEGAPVWKKWLGDPLMSMPAVAAGRVYMAYPDSEGDHRHYLACFHLRTGEEYWKQPIEGEIIAAPVLADGAVHIATLGGTLYRLRQEDGRVEWQEARSATSSPVVWRASACSATAGKSSRATRRGPTSSRPSTSPRGGCATRRSDTTPGRPGSPTTSTTPSGPGIRRD